jgi:hypothetical protein
MTQQKPDHLRADPDITKIHDLPRIKLEWLPNVCDKIGHNTLAELVVGEKHQFSGDHWQIFRNLRGGHRVGCRQFGPIGGGRRIGVVGSVWERVCQSFLRPTP